MSDKEAKSGEGEAGPAVVKLRNPIQFGSRVIDELTIQRPKAKHFREWRLRDDYEIDSMIVMAGRLSGEPNRVIDELEGQDLWEVIDLVSGFIRSSRKTGQKPSES